MFPTLVWLSVVVAAFDAVNQRPTYHVMPPSNWINDPNGPVFYNGVYHLFMQYNPWQPVWGNMSWYHVVSDNLVAWTQVGVAMTNDEWYDQNGCFTGSITVLPGSGSGNGPVLIYTCVGNDGGQRLCRARPANLSDPYLVEWTKDPNNPLESFASSDQFEVTRDPTTAWIDDETGQMSFLTGATLGPAYAVNNIGGMLRWMTRDLSFVELGDVFYQNSMYQMMECPDFFNVSAPSSTSTSTNAAVHVLKWSIGQDYYVLGTFDPRSGPQFVDNDKWGQSRLLDYGTVYASKRFWDPVGQRHILWSWISETDSNAASRGWQGMQSLPAEITLEHSADNQPPGLLINPIPELAKLRTATLFQSTVNLTPFQPLVFTDAMGMFLDILVTFSNFDWTSATNFGLQIRRNTDGSQFTYVNFRFVNETDAQSHPNTGLSDCLVYKWVTLDGTQPPAEGNQICKGYCKDEAVSGLCAGWAYYPANGKCALTTATSVFSPSNGQNCGMTRQVHIVNDRTRSGTINSSPNSIQGGPVPVQVENGTLSMRVLMDASVIHTYAQNGNARVTTRVYPEDPTALGVALYSEVPVTANIEVFEMGSIWS